jgi:MtN3 and saliva related transmembrane protein
MALFYQLTGFIGSCIVICAYVPQIAHLIKEHCAAGISRYAYILWFIASALLLVHAVMIRDTIFIVLQSINFVSTGIILFFAEKYKYGLCPFHRQGGHF